MKEKYKSGFNMLLNIVLLITITSITYSWMITAPSLGEIADYNRNLIVTSSDVTVKTYYYRNSQYIEQTTGPLNIGLLAPGVVQRFRFDITNSSDAMSSSKIVFSNITGDIDALGEFLVFGSSSPKIYSFKLEARVRQNPSDLTYYIEFLDLINVPANSTLSLYWYTSVLNTATNDIASKNITIDKITFIKP